MAIHSESDSVRDELSSGIRFDDGDAVDSGGDGRDGGGDDVGDGGDGDGDGDGGGDDDRHCDDTNEDVHY